MLADRSRLLAGAAALALAAASNARANAASDVDSVVVTARLEESLPAEIAQYGARLNVVTNRQIETGGYTDAGQALVSTVPGLYFAPQSGPFSYGAASLQGSRPNELLYLIDGVRISNRLYNTTPPLDTVPAHMIDHIEVLEGGESLFYGTQAVAGVVNIVTRPFTTAWRGQASASGDTNGAFAVDGYVSGALGGSKFVAFASHDQAMGFQPFPDADYQSSATDRNRGYRLDQVGAKYAYDVSSALRFSASFTHTEGYVDYLRPTLVVNAVNFRNEELATAKLDWLPSQAFQVFLKGYWHDWSSHYDETDNDDLAKHTTEHVDDHEFWGFHDYGVNAVAKYVPAKGVEVYGGYDLQKYGGRDDVLLIAQQNETANAVFGQLRLTPDLVPRVHLAAGVRYNDVSVGQSATVWNVSGQVDITDNLFVRANGGTGFRLPDAESLFAQDPINNGEVGNPNLRPERSRSVNGSVGGRFATPGGFANWELIGFARSTKDLISLDGPTADPDVLTFINTPDEVKVTGFEATFNADVTRDWSISGSYTHAHAREDGAKVQFVGIPEDYAQGGLDWHPVNLPIGGSFVGNWVGEVADNVSGFGRQERGHYAVFDLNAYVDFGPGRKERLAIRLENLFDAGYATRINRAFTDTTGDAYLTHYLGVPRTLHVSFTAKL